MSLGCVFLHGNRNSHRMGLDNLDERIRNVSRPFYGDRIEHARDVDGIGYCAINRIKLLFGPNHHDYGGITFDFSYSIARREGPHDTWPHLHLTLRTNIELDMHLAR